MKVEHTGMVNDTRDSAHWRYREGGGCPAGFPHQMTTLTFALQFDYTGNASKNLVLSSDVQFNTAPGGSLHGDFWNTWQQAGLEQMIDRCVRSNGKIFPNEC